MRTKQIIEGFNNSQKFRFLVRQPDIENSVDFGMTLTIQEFFDKIATSLVRQAVTDVLVNLSHDRSVARRKHGWTGVPTGIVKRTEIYDYKNQLVNLDVQIDLA